MHFAKWMELESFKAAYHLDDKGYWLTSKTN